MAALIITALIGCFSQPPAFPCSGVEGGYEIYPEVGDEPASAAQREVVRGAVARGLVTGDVDEERVARAMARHARSPRFWSALRERAATYAEVLAVARAEGARDVLVAGAYAASRFNTRYVSRDCRDGPWQLPVATRGVARCQLRDGSWLQPDEPVPTDPDICPIVSCREDPRRDLITSTKLALDRLPAGATDWDALAALDLGDPAIPVAVHLLAVCAHPELFPGVDQTHCGQVSEPCEALPPTW